MHKLLALICVTLMVKTAFTAVSRQSPVEKPEDLADQEGCYNPELNLVLPYNVNYSPQDGKSCKRYLCQSDGWTQIFTCGAIGVAPNCERVPGDWNLPYPDCCDTVECDEKSCEDEK